LKLLTNRLDLEYFYGSVMFGLYDVRGLRGVHGSGFEFATLQPFPAAFFTPTEVKSLLKQWSDDRGIATVHDEVANYMYYETAGHPGYVGFYGDRLDAWVKAHNKKEMDEDSLVALRQSVQFERQLKDSRPVQRMLRVLDSADELQRALIKNVIINGSVPAKLIENMYEWMGLSGIFREQDDRVSLVSPLSRHAFITFAGLKFATAASQPMSLEEFQSCSVPLIGLFERAMPFVSNLELLSSATVSGKQLVGESVPVPAEYAYESMVVPVLKGLCSGSIGRVSAQPARLAVRDGAPGRAMTVDVFIDNNKMFLLELKANVPRAVIVKSMERLCNKKLMSMENAKIDNPEKQLLMVVFGVNNNLIFKDLFENEFGIQLLFIIHERLSDQYTFYSKARPEGYPIRQFGPSTIVDNKPL